jgi:SpoIID/LytB domain protein
MVLTLCSSLLGDVKVASGHGLSSATIEISGYGFGHGRGMGQWGAYGYATIYGWSYQQVLAHYYGGTTLGALASPDPLVTVHLTEFDGRNTIASAVGGETLVASWGAGTSASGAAFEVVRASGGEVIWSGPGCAGPWSKVAVSTGPVTVASASPGSDPPVAAPAPSSELQACLPGLGARTYQGDLVSLLNGQTDNVVTLEDYLDGVVPAEAPVSWAATGGEAALEAQAVAARSYVMAVMAAGGSPGSPGAICDTSACQVYTAWPDQYGVTADSAVEATAGQVLYCAPGSSCGPAGSIALAEYSSSTGGYTAGGAFPAVPDLGDSVAANPVHAWVVTVAVSQVQSLFPSVGALRAIRVDSRNGLGLLGGRVEALSVIGSAGSVSLTGSEFAADLGLRSDWFEVAPWAPLVGPTSSTTARPTTTTTATARPTTTTTATARPTTTTTTTASTTTTSSGPGPVTTVLVPGSTTAPAPVPPAPSGNDNGYWVADAEGDVHGFGGAVSYGGAVGTPLAGQVTAMAATPGSRGYWLVGSQGGVLAFGDAHWYGSPSKVRLRKPIVAMAATPDGAGYWLVSKGGGVFSYGDAHYYGSAGHLHLSRPIVGMASSPDGRGYWLVTSDGGLFAYGDARLYGSTGHLRLDRAVSGIVPSADGKGYFLVAKDGGVFAFGDAKYEGSLPEEHIAATVAAVAPTPSGAGYYVLATSGRVYSFGDATGYGDLRSAVVGWRGTAVAIVGHR